MNSAIVVFPGSNCDQDLAKAINFVSPRKSLMLWHKETSIPKNTDIIFLPGGFSFGDYLRCGAMAAKSPIMKAIIKFANNVGYLVGICNGFQILTEAKLLPGVLIRNAKLRFICKEQAIRVETNKSIFTKSFKENELISWQIAHHEGNYYANSNELEKLKDRDQIVLTYVGNPNGSVCNIAGVLSDNRRVIGMMPHPERSVEPNFTSKHGFTFFSSLVQELN
jgi:phosphoribosylformylglycinamidine synthase I